MMEPVLKVFVAGSKDLKNERMICRSVCNRLQNQWGIIVTKSFEDFPETISREGHQNEYNTFIREQADVVMFVFSGKVGEITRVEFEHAWHAFTENGHPQILVYIDQLEQAASSDIDDLKSLPIRAYLDKTVVPILLLGLAETAKERSFRFRTGDV